MKKLIGSISVALTLALSVFGLAACDLVNFNWGTGSDHEHHFTEYEATDPTCTKNGNYRYFKCDVGPDPCGRYYRDLAAMEPVSEESVMIPALGHKYDFTKIVWSEWNGKEITASVTCTQCDEEEPGHVLHPEITVKFTQTKAPTCTAKGEGYYTASFTYEGETYTNPTTKTAEVDMIPHTYNKTPDDDWKWADDHTSVSATFTCTAADCTHKETVTVSGAAITSKVETIKGVCTDGSQTVYTATAEFNGETYDLTDTVVTLEAINEHKAGDWQYDATQHWHKCSVCGEDMDDKASHQVDPTTHKCECGYVEKSYTVTALTLAANAENTAAILTIGGTYTGYDQQGLTELFCVQNAQGNYFFNFWGDGIGRENAKSVTLTKWENGGFSVALDVTDLPVCELRNICRTDLGDQDWKLSTETIQETTITVGEKVYTLQPSNGHDWNNIGLEVASKTVEKAHTITDAVIAEKDGKVYVTVTGTYAGYANAAEFLADLQDGQDTTKLGFCVFKNSDGWGKVIDYDSELIQYSAKDDDGNKFTVQIDVTDLPARGYQIGHDYSSEGDIKTVNYTGTAETATKTYELVGNTGNLTLTIKEKQAEVDGTFTLTGVTLEVDTTAVYVVYKGTHTCTDPAALKAKFEAKAFEIYVKELIPESNRTVTVDATTWTIKANVSSMNLADGAYYIWFNGDSGPGDIRLSLEAAPNITKTFGEKDYSIENHYGEASDNPHFWGCVILRIAPTKGAPTYEITKFTIEEDGNGKFYLVYGGTCENYEQAALQTALKADLALNVHYTQESNKKASGEWVITANQTEWTAKLDITVGTDVFVVGGKYYIDGTNGWDSKTFYKLWPAVSSKDEVQVANENYIYTLGGQDGSLYSNVTFTITAVAPAKTATFGIANLQNDGGVRVLLRITATGFEADDLKPENIELSIDETNKVNAYLKTGDNEYYFYVKDFTTGGNLKVTIGGVEFTKNLASEVAADQNKQFVNPNFYTLALNGDDLVLTVYNAAEAFTLNGISLKNTDGTVNLTLTGTTTAADATAKLFLENYGYCYYKNGRQQFANKTVTVEGGDFTFTVDVTDLGAGSYTLLARDADGTDLTNGDISLESITDKEATKDSINYSIVNVEGTKLALLIEDSAHETNYNKLSLKATADTLYLVIEGTYSGYSIEDIKAVLENTDGAKEPYSFSIYDGFGKNFPREATVTPSKDGATDGTWKLEINITTFQTTGVPHHILERDAGGGDLKVKDGKPEFESTVVEFKNLNYSLVLDGDILSLKVEDATQPSYEIASGSVELEGGKAYFSVNGTYKNYEEDGLKAALETVEFWFTRYGDYPEIGQGTSEKRTPFTTEPEISVDTEAKTWKVSVDVTNFENGTWIAKFPGDIKLAGSKDGQTVEVGDKTYSIFNKYPDGSEQPSIWGCTCLLVEDALKENEINFGGESVSTVHPDHMFYWNGDTEGTNATVTTKTAVDGVYTFQYTLTETAKGNAGLWYAVQLFYKNSELKENTVYTLTFQLKSSVTGKITVNGTVIDLTGSNQVQAVSVEYTQTAKASLSIQFGVDDGSNEKKGSHIDGGEFVISDLKWQEKTSGPEEPPAEKSATFAGSGMNNNNGKLRFFLNVKPSGYSADEITGNENLYVTINGQKYYPTEGALAVDTNAPIFFDIDISELQAGQYPVQLYLGGKTYDRPSVNCFGSVEIGNKSFAFSDVEGKLTLTVTAKGGEEPPAEKDPKITSANLAFDPDLLSFTFNTENCTQEILQGAKLLVNGEESSDIRFDQVLATGVENQFKAIYNIASLGEGTYTLVYQLNGTDYNFVDNLPGVYTYNNKTYTLANAEGKLQLTVAAVTPAADGSKDAPFSVSDLAAIFNNAENLNEDGYYEKDGVVPKVYVKGMVTNAEAISEITGKNAGKGYYKIWIKAISTSEIALAADFGPDTEFVIFQAFWNDTMQQGMKFQNGDIIIVSGYLQKYTSQQGDTTYEITYYNNENPAIETWESVNEGNKGADAELEWEAIKKALSISEDKLTLENEVALPKPTRPNVTFTFAVREGENSDKLTIANEKMTPTRGESQVTGITVNVTIKVGGEDHARSFTVTIPEKEAEPTDSGWYVVDALSKIESGVRIVFVYADKNIVSGGFSGKYMSGITGVVFNEDKSMITTLPGGAVVWTVGGEENAWTFTSTEGTLAQTGSSKNTLSGSGSNTAWTITINDDNTAKISNNAYPSDDSAYYIQFNASTSDLSNYNSPQVLPTIYRWYGEWVEPHKCGHQCPTCNKCTDEGCDDPVCADKCKGHESVSGSYTLVTSEEQLHAGDTIVFVYEQYTFGTYDSSKKRFNGMTGVTYSEDKNVITSLPKNTIVWTVGGQKDAWTFYATIDDTTSGYLAQTGNTSGQATALSTTNNTWTLTFKDGSLNAITNGNQNTYKFQFNPNPSGNSPIFSNYTSAQKTPSIYVAS